MQWKQGRTGETCDAGVLRVCLFEERDSWEVFLYLIEGVVIGTTTKVIRLAVLKIYPQEGVVLEHGQPSRMRVKRIDGDQREAAREIALEEAALWLQRNIARVREPGFKGA
jgi:hypothetical protein